MNRVVVKRIVLLLAVLAVLVPSSLAMAQTEPAMEIVDINTERYDLNGSTTIVVEFRNLDGELDPEQLTVTANGQSVQLVGVEPLGQTQEPVGIVLVIDVSGSMEGAPMEAAKAAATNFVSQKRPGDFIALVTFGDTVQTVSGFTTNIEALTARIAELEAGGETAFNDGVIQGINLFEQSNASALRRNIIVLTDGADTVSTSTIDDVLAAINNPNNPVRVFGVALESPEFQPATVQQIADAGEGLFLSTSDPAQLAALYGQIQREIGNLLVVRLGSPVFNAGPVEFSVTYAGLSAVQTVDVSGFVTTTLPAPSTTVTFESAEPFVVRSNLPISASSLLGLAALGLGAAIGLFIFILFGRSGEDAGSVFKRRLEAYGRRGAAEEKKSLFDRIPLLRLFSQKAEEEVRRRGLLSGVNSALEQANIPLSAGEAVAGGFGLSAVIGVLAALFTGNPIMGGVFFAFGILIVIGLLNFLGGREKRRFENQLPDTLTLISTSLRAGYSLLQAVEAVATEAPNPTAREFGRAIVEARLGRQVVAALQGITTRTQSQDFEWAVMAIEIQREVGGNLAEVLQTVSETMRQRNRLKGEIRALTAEGRISAIVLGILPFAMGGFLFASNPEYIGTLFSTTFGIVALIAGGLLMIAGGIWLRKIVDIEV
ncbi:MAG TPA: type II secretion system F family protein [Acidimicrobiia bacterium]|nr:type II secretion system F family protein [Acidimicrobiia bacterium]